MNKLNSFQGWTVGSNIHKLVSCISNMTQIKNHPIISPGTKMILDTLQYPFMIKALKRLRRNIPQNSKGHM